MLTTGIPSSQVGAHDEVKRAGIRLLASEKVRKDEATIPLNMLSKFEDSD